MCRWYRGEILALKDDEYEVFFGDYGDIEWIEYSKVLPLDESLLEVYTTLIQCMTRSIYITQFTMWPCPLCILYLIQNDFVYTVILYFISILF